MCEEILTNNTLWGSLQSIITCISLSSQYHGVILLGDVLIGNSAMAFAED